MSHQGIISSRNCKDCYIYKEESERQDFFLIRLENTLIAPSRPRNEDEDEDHPKE